MERIFGLEIESLPPGAIASDIVIVVKALLPDGRDVLLNRASRGMAPWDRVGLLDSALTIAKVQVMGGLEAPPDEFGT